ncbi:hypothetical protein AKJ16_DCAP02275, partial [Drosera capensis]
MPSLSFSSSNSSPTMMRCDRRVLSSFDFASMNFGSDDEYDDGFLMNRSLKRDSAILLMEFLGIRLISSRRGG